VPLIDELLEAQESADRIRSERIARAWAIYRGDHPRPLRVREGEPDDNVILNLAGLVVDTGVDALFGQELGIAAEPGAEASEARDWLDAAWERNRGMLTLQAAATNGAVSGQAALRILPAEGRIPPRLVVVDPQMLRVVWAPDDVGVVLGYAICWMTRDDRSQPLERRQLIQRDGAQWVISDQQRAGAGRWQAMPDGETVWPYPWPPIVDCQNLPEPNAWWGRPDLTSDVLDTQAAVNRVLSNAARVQRIHGHPKVWAKGVGDGEGLDVAPDEAILLPDTDSEIGTLEPRSHVADHVELYRVVKASLHEIARVPEITAGRLEGIGQLSGLALQILYGPLVRKTETKRRLYGELVRTVSQRMLELAGFGAEVEVDLHWPEVVPSDDLEQATAAEALQRAGVSRATALQAMGYDPEAEAEHRQEEAANLGAALLDNFERGRGA
jgi:hypothetical protein